MFWFRTPAEPEAVITSRHLCSYPCREKVKHRPVSRWETCIRLVIGSVSRDSGLLRLGFRLLFLVTRFRPTNNTENRRPSRTLGAWPKITMMRAKGREKETGDVNQQLQHGKIRLKLHTDPTPRAPKPWFHRPISCPPTQDPVPETSNPRGRLHPPESKNTGHSPLYNFRSQMTAASLPKQEWNVRWALNVGSSYISIIILFRTW